MELKLTPHALEPIPYAKPVWQPEDTPPLTPMRDCRFCGEPAGLITPGHIAACAPCWREHTELQVHRKEDESWVTSHDVEA